MRRDRLCSLSRRWSQRGFAALLLGLILAAGLAGCGYYSFTGATIPSHLNSIAIPLAEDNSLSSITNLNEQLTRLLVDRFVGQTRLNLDSDENTADAVLQATIERYTNAPAAVSGNEVATLNRVTISVAVRYVDRVEEKEVLQRSFSGYDEYDPLGDLQAGEEAAAAAALEKIANDVFTESTSNW